MKIERKLYRHCRPDNWYRIYIPSRMAADEQVG